MRKKRAGPGLSALALVAVVVPTSSTTATTSDFEVTNDGDGTTNDVTGVAVSGATVELTLTNVVKYGQTVTVSYEDPSFKIK